MNAIPMLNTPSAAAASSPPASSAPAAGATDATAVFAVLLGGGQGALTPAASIPTTGAASPATGDGAVPIAAAPAESNKAPALPDVLEQLGMAAPEANAEPGVAADGAAAAALAGLPEVEAGSDESDLDEAADAALAAVDVSAFIVPNLAPSAPAAETAAPGGTSAIGQSSAAALPTPSAVATQAGSSAPGALEPTDHAPIGAGARLADSPAPNHPAPEAVADTDQGFAAALDQVDKYEGDGSSPINGGLATTPLASTPDVRPNQPAIRPTVLPQIEMPRDTAAGFDETLGARMSVALDQGISHARIRVSPEHLGAIDLQVSVEGDKVTAQFHSQHADVRAALEASMVRLREHLAEQGLQLAGAHVGGQGAGAAGQGAAEQQARNGQPFAAAGADGAGGSSLEGVTVLEVAAPPVRQVGLVDEYA